MMKPLTTTEIYFISCYVAACTFVISIVPILCLRLESCIRLRRKFGIRRKASSTFSKRGLCVEVVEKLPKQRESTPLLRRLKSVFSVKAKTTAQPVVELAKTEKRDTTAPAKTADQVSADKKDRALEKERQKAEIKEKKEKQKAELRARKEAEKRAKEERKRAELSKKRAAKAARKKVSAETRSRTREMPESRTTRLTATTTITQGGGAAAPLTAPKPVEPTDAKELAIRRGQLVRAKTDYPTMEDVLSDWERSTKKDTPPPAAAATPKK